MVETSVTGITYFTNNEVRFVQNWINSKLILGNVMLNGLMKRKRMKWNREVDKHDMTSFSTSPEYPPKNIRHVKQEELMYELK